MSSCLPYEVLLLLLLTEVFEDIVLRAFLETFITSTNVSRRLHGEVGKTVFSKNYIAAVLGKRWNRIQLSSIKLPLLSNLQR